ncbi:Uncharacterised protein [Streptococcus pseudoporcinus]|uniref:Uncharacterized protein n=1 Tax=Streptococcus pseudoporcinus TaxID=361101 RepID=A0A4V6KZN9_9STRE|nr:hypothetical protein [Streptococcus pseudoporcinus]VTS13427.1 Uncharacterised protein [Streptococcus pseudoporcinus]VTS19382.1 Uncharacterised protein [Streptococcus pseudoporcinus]VTS32394.1 Uncharacterised protein [Streptococcus pseudoporcinus]
MGLTITQSLILLPVGILALVKLLKSDYTTEIEIEEVEVREQPIDFYGRIIQTSAEIR